MRNKHTFFIIVTLWMSTIHPIPSSAQTIPQTKLTGRITDASTGEPLYFANVFLSNTTLGCATDKDGRYIIENVPSGHYELVASIIGYEIGKKRIILSDSTETVFNFQLTPKTIQGETIEVTASEPKEWKHQLKVFEKLFFSVNEFAKDCEIENPEVLDFNYDPEKSLFEASAEAPILLTNKAIGYEVTFLMEKFRAILKTDLDEILRQKYDRGQSLDYKGVIRFKEITPKNKGQKKKWKENRLKAYLGSKRHFFKSLVEGRLKEEGFEITRTDVPSSKYAFKMSADKILHNGPNPSLHTLSFSDYLSVTYINESDNIQYAIDQINADLNKKPDEEPVFFPKHFAQRDYRDRPRTIKNKLALDKGVEPTPQASWLKLTEGMPITIDMNGVITLGQDNIIYSGYWWWDSPAEWLPMHYTPEKK